MVGSRHGCAASLAYTSTAARIARKVSNIPWLMVELAALSRAIAVRNGSSSEPDVRFGIRGRCHWRSRGSSKSGSGHHFGKTVRLAADQRRGSVWGGRSSRRRPARRATSDVHRHSPVRTMCSRATGERYCSSSSGISRPAAGRQRGQRDTSLLPPACQVDRCFAREARPRVTSPGHERRQLRPRGLHAGLPPRVPRDVARTRRDGRRRGPGQPAECRLTPDPAAESLEKHDTRRAPRVHRSG